MKGAKQQVSDSSINFSATKSRPDKSRQEKLINSDNKEKNKLQEKPDNNFKKENETIKLNNPPNNKPLNVKTNENYYNFDKELSNIIEVNNEDQTIHLDKLNNSNFNNNTINNTIIQNNNNTFRDYSSLKNDLELFEDECKISNEKLQNNNINKQEKKDNEKDQNVDSKQINTNINSNKKSIKVKENKNINEEKDNKKDNEKKNNDNKFESLKKRRMKKEFNNNNASLDKKKSEEEELNSIIVENKNMKNILDNQVGKNKIDKNYKVEKNLDSKNIEVERNEESIKRKNFENKYIKTVKINNNKFYLRFHIEQLLIKKHFVCEFGIVLRPKIELKLSNKNVFIFNVKDEEKKGNLNKRSNSVIIRQNDSSLLQGEINKQDLTSNLDKNTNNEEFYGFKNYIFRDVKKFFNYKIFFNLITAKTPFNYILKQTPFN